MELQTINNIIGEAKQHEADTQHLHKLLINHISDIHRSIELPDDNPEEVLVDFINRYVEHVPQFIECISSAAREAGIEEYVMPFLEVAKKYFLHPPKVVTNQHIGLDSLMDEAYLAHRLIEEINDFFITKAGIPLIPMDMTRANIVIHHLIGEPFANELDSVAHLTAEQMMDNDHGYDSEKFKQYVQIRKGKGWSEVWKQWSCLAKDFQVELKFKGSAI